MKNKNCSFEVIWGCSQMIYPGEIGRHSGGDLGVDGRRLGMPTGKGLASVPTGRRARPSGWAYRERPNGRAYRTSSRPAALSAENSVSHEDVATFTLNAVTARTGSI